MGGLAGVERRRMDRIAVITARSSDGVLASGAQCRLVSVVWGSGYRISPGRLCLLQRGSRLLLVKLSTMLSTMLMMIMMRPSTMFPMGPARDDDCGMESENGRQSKEKRMRPM